MIKRNLVIFSCLLFLASCSKPLSGEEIGTFSELGNSKYVIGFSDIIDPGSKIALFNEEGDLLEDLKFPGLNLSDSVASEDRLYIAGHRGYQHAEIERSTGILSVLKHPEKADGWGGAYQMNVDSGYLFYDVNAGATEDSNGKYISYFVFGEENQEDRIVTEVEGTIHTAFLIEDEFYVYTESEKISGDDDHLEAEYFHNFFIINKETGEVKDKMVLDIDENIFPTNTSNKIYSIFNDQIMMSFSDGDQSKDTQLVSFDWRTGTVEVVKTFPLSFRPIALIPYQDTLMIINESGSAKVLDDDYSEVNEFTIDADFDKFVDLYVGENQLFFLTYDNSNSEINGEISTFELADGKKSNEVPIRYDKDYEQAKLIVVE
ncbi:hypothetical protein ACI2JA_17325 [Alkalihalobacillus sp. NPDC078783]